MKSWKTTIGGLLSGAGLAFSQFFPRYSQWGGFAAAIGAVLLGLAARDNDKSSEDVGAKNGGPVTIPIQVGRVTPCAPNPDRTGLLSLLLISFLLFGSGCAPMSPHQLVKELENDQAIVVGKVGTIYGTGSFVRIGQTTNSVSVSPDGTVSVNK